MAFYRLFLDNDTDVTLDFDYEKIAGDVIGQTLIHESCPLDVEVNVLLTDDEGIRAYNRDMRGIDRPTDVLSFPNIEFTAAGDYPAIDNEAGCIDPETELVILGDIIISLDRVKAQAKEYGHGCKREYAFLIAHSMLHLSGYDHESEDEAACMELKQEEILSALGLTRD